MQKDLFFHEAQIDVCRVETIKSRFEFIIVAISSATDNLRLYSQFNYDNNT